MIPRRFLQAMAILAVVLESIIPVQAMDSGRGEASNTDRSLGNTVNLQKEIVQSEANQLVALFAKSLPEGVFERVRLTMADEMEAGRAKTLEDAYILAVDQHFKVTVDNYSKLGLSRDDWLWLLTVRSKPQVYSQEAK
jgi:hypothetical protein